MISKDLLPEKICLEDYGGDYKAYIDAIYEVFARDFIRHKTSFGLHKLSMKYHPAFQERAYTFYHMTHKGNRVGTGTGFTSLRVYAVGATDY